MQIKHNLYIGDITSVKSKSLESLQISAIINLTDDKINCTGIEVFDYYLPDQELLDTEFGKTIKKLDTIIDDIKYLHQLNHSVLICCFDGRNKSALVAGYYLISIGEHSSKVITMLDTLYFTPEMRVQEEIYKKQIQDEQNGIVPFASGDELILRLSLAESRNKIRCLTLQSFQKIILMAANKK